MLSAFSRWLVAGIYFSICNKFMSKQITSLTKSCNQIRANMLLLYISFTVQKRQRKRHLPLLKGNFKKWIALNNNVWIISIKRIATGHPVVNGDVRLPCVVQAIARSRMRVGKHTRISWGKKMMWTETILSYPWQNWYYFPVYFLACSWPIL